MWYFSDIVNIGFNLGYEITMTDNYDIIVTPVTNEVVPEITVRTVPTDDGYYYDATLEFPTLSSAEYHYSDSVSNILDNWGKIGDLVTAICEFVHIPE